MSHREKRHPHLSGYGSNPRSCRSGVTSCPKLKTILGKRVLAALVQSGVPAFLPPSGTLAPQESPAR